MSRGLFATAKLLNTEFHMVVSRDQTKEALK